MKVRLQNVAAGCFVSLVVKLGQKLAKSEAQAIGWLSS
jgi:hypothetical protein